MDSVYWLGVLGVVLIATAAAVHALLNKREPTTAFGWIAVCILFPLAGPALYYLFGIDRLRLKARALRAGALQPHEASPAVETVAVQPEFAQQVRISGAVTGLPLTAGNQLKALHNGEAAYPAMLEAIDNARESIFLATYIFESNVSGHRFAEALGRAVERGLDVRVLLDGAGEWYSFPRIRHRLRELDVPVARFLPPRLLPPSLLVNLRNHRKILVTDGDTAFIGGMNIGDRHLADARGRRRGVRDLHLRIRGPVVHQIESVFLDDWAFTTGEADQAERPRPGPVGNAICRTIIDGPNDDLNRIAMILIGAIAAARERVRIMTPYFLPPRKLIAALQTAAIRGIAVDIILPERSNLPFMHWASRNLLWEMVEWGVNVHYRPGTFTHTKLLVVDDHYAQVGSANLDPRSLDLNFELMLEVYGADFAGSLAEHFKEVLAECRTVTLAELENRSAGARVRDAFCWLFTPYL